MQGITPIYMPVQQPVLHPPQAMSQPQPVDPTLKKIEEAKANIGKYAKRLSCSSMFFIIMGILGCFLSTYYQFTAKFHAMKMVGDDELSEGQNRGTHIIREEFEIYDGIKTMTALSFFFFAKLILLGKCAKKASWKKKSAFTKKTMKMSLICLFLLVIVAVLYKKEAQKISKIVKKANQSKDDELSVKTIPQQGQDLRQRVMSTLKATDCNCNHPGDGNACKACGNCKWIKPDGSSTCLCSPKNNVPAGAANCGTQDSVDEIQAKEESKFRILIQKKTGHNQIQQAEDYDDEVHNVKHGYYNRAKHGYERGGRSCKMMHLFMVVLIAFHFYTMKMLYDHQEEFEQLQKKLVRQVKQAQQPVAFAPQVMMTQPVNTGSIVDINQMI